MRGSNSKGNFGSSGNLEDEILLLLLQQQQQQNRSLILERDGDFNINRSGSAPPTVEGALRSAGNIFNYPNFVQFNDNGSNSNNRAGIAELTEEEIRSHPAYLEYYYSHENLNPRLPPPLLSKEDWCVAQRLNAAGHGFGDLGDWQNKVWVDRGGNLPLFSMEAIMSHRKPEDDTELRKTAIRNLSRKNSSEVLNKASTDFVGTSSSEMGVRRKSFADILQEGLSQQMAPPHLSRPVSLNSVGDALDVNAISGTKAAEIQNSAESFETMVPKKSVTNFSSRQHINPGISSSFTTSLSSPLTHRIELLGNSPSPGIFSSGPGVHLADSLNTVTSNDRIGPTSSIFEVADSLSGLNMSKGKANDQDVLKSSFQMGRPTMGAHNLNYVDKFRAGNLVNDINFAEFARVNEIMREQNAQRSLLNERSSFARRSFSTSNLQSHPKPFDFSTLEGMKILCEEYSRHGSHFTGAIEDGQRVKSNNQTVLHFPVMDPHQIQYMQKLPNHGRIIPHISGNSNQGRHAPPGYEDMKTLEKVYLEAMLAQQKQQYQPQFLQRSSSANHQQHWTPVYDPGAASDHANRVASAAQCTITSRSPVPNHEKNSQSHSTLKHVNGESTGPLDSKNGSNANGRSESLLEMVKNNKMKSLELSDVLTHAVEFSMDQHGSRFIQQKLETANVNEKMKVFSEIVPHAHSLMTDVYGNYVIQKFFEHGTGSQRKELAGHLIGHVLSLSLQMYGCRVIQKALEVTDVELQTKMISELHGSILKCVRDQNGNHVIQKCIECVPQDRIGFIISSFYGQVVNLSTHPYGCRVIQRVLEHCDNPKIQEIIIGEIMGSVCSLALDQYGNYVVQHVLQHGKPQVRAVIIRKLAGQIVKMSQQKFASNVVEKCLTFGGPEERKLLVNEILGSTYENEPLKAMMKDPFGNYVVQKVLETCDNESRELILSRIKVHLTILKKYTYGKHIVSLVEKLVTTGEKHVGKSSSDPS